MKDIRIDQLFSKFFKKKSDAVVGIDIGGAFAKVVELKSKGGRALLNTYGEIALGPFGGIEVGQATNLPTDKLAEALRDLLVEAKVTSHDVVFALPLMSTLLTVIELPDLGEAKLKEMIPIEARKYIPTPVSEVALSYWIIPKTTRTYIDPDEEERKKGIGPTANVLLAAVHNDVLAKYNDLGTKIGAESVSFEIEVFASIRAALGREAATTMLVDIGAANTKVVIIEEGIVRSSHLVAVGSQDITLTIARGKGIALLEAEEKKRRTGLLGDPSDPVLAEITRLAVERIMSEVGRILSTYQHEKRITISRVIFTGGGSLLPGLLDLAGKHFNVTVSYGNAFEKVEAPAVLEPLLKEAGPEFAVAIGLALRKL